MTISRLGWPLVIIGFFFLSGGIFGLNLPCVLVFAGALIMALA